MIEIKNVTKKFEDGTVAIKDITLKINDGDIYGILGLSGAGKSTLVRCINGLETFDSGSIYYNGNLIADDKVRVSRDIKRKISMIFQQFNLLDQRTVLQNVEIAGELTHQKDRHQKALDLLKKVGLEDKIKSYPSMLSGGQQQRVAIARALMNDPDVLLCDEATSALDAETTDSILQLLKKLNKDLGLTIIIIAHQMSVIESICNKVAIIDKSKIVEEGLLSDVFLNPQSEVGQKLIHAGKVTTKLDDKNLIRLVFDGETDVPLIANIVQDCNILVSIVSADTKTIDGKSYGHIMIKLPYYDEDIAKLKKYLKLKKVKFEEVAYD